MSDWSKFLPGIGAQRRKWATERFAQFEQSVKLVGATGGILLDLGGSDGRYMREHLPASHGLKVVVADIDDVALRRAEAAGFATAKLEEGGRLPFSDQEIDFVFCNSVIEHVTAPKNLVWHLSDAKQFESVSRDAQAKFAKEIDRIAKAYFVQTPHRLFPIEAHTWFPFFGVMPRSYQLPLMRVLNTFWPKKTSPDFYLLDEAGMRSLFPEARIIVNRIWGCPKDIIAVKC